MTIEQEPQPQFTIAEMTVEDIDAATEMRLQSWVDTYTNEEAGVTEEWIRQRFDSQLSPDTREARVDRFNKAKEAGTFNAWIAKSSRGEVVGSTTPFVSPDGNQHVGSIYIDKAWYGTGLGSKLMQKVTDWLDPSKPIELGVATYNERAKAFYRKWGFEEVPDSEEVYAGKIPEVKMIRPPVENEGEK